MSRSILSVASAVVLLAATSSAQAPTPTTPPTQKWFSTTDCTGSVSSASALPIDECKVDAGASGTIGHSSKRTRFDMAFALVSIFLNETTFAPNPDGDCTETPYYTISVSCGQCEWSEKNGYQINVCDAAGQWYHKDTDCNSDCSNCSNPSPKAYVGQCSYGGYLALHWVATGPALVEVNYNSSDCSGLESNNGGICDLCTNYSWANVGPTMRSYIYECGTGHSWPTIPIMTSSSAAAATNTTTTAAASAVGSPVTSASGATAGADASEAQTSTTEDRALPSTSGSSGASAPLVGLASMVAALAIACLTL